MSHIRLIRQYINIFDTSQLDDLHDMLTDDFYFRNPRMELVGRNNFITYAKDCYGVYTTENLVITLQSADKYKLEYDVTIYDVRTKSVDKISTCEWVVVRQGLLCSATVEYDVNNMSSASQNVLIDAALRHGNSIENQ